jgi:hypothetical protein
MIKAEFEGSSFYVCKNKECENFLKWIELIRGCAEFGYIHPLRAEAIIQTEITCSFKYRQCVVHTWSQDVYNALNNHKGNLTIPPGLGIYGRRRSVCEEKNR